MDRRDGLTDGQSLLWSRESATKKKENVCYRREAMYKEIFGVVCRNVRNMSASIMIIVFIDYDHMVIKQRRLG